jgi:hypothetical protein
LPEIAKRSREFVGLFLPKLDAQLAGNAFVAWDRYTASGITEVFLIRA